jgi:hypothetical protein
MAKVAGTKGRDDAAQDFRAVERVDCEGERDGELVQLFLDVGGEHRADRRGLFEQTGMEGGGEDVFGILEQGELAADESDLVGVHGDLGFDRAAAGVACLVPRVCGSIVTGRSRRNIGRAGV